MTIGRVFKFNEQGMSLTLRMNFQNVFNRTEMPNPDGGPTTATTHVNPQGTLEMRFQF